MELREGGSAVGSEEATLVERAKGGDVTAYEELVPGHEAVAFRAAFTITGDAAEAEDAAQEAFVKVYRILDRFRSGAPFRPWLFSVVTNEARNRRRAAARRPGLTLRAAEHGSWSAPPSPETRGLDPRGQPVKRSPRPLTPSYRLFLALPFFSASLCWVPLGAGWSGDAVSSSGFARRPSSGWAASAASGTSSSAPGLGALR